MLPSPVSSPTSPRIHRLAAFFYGVFAYGVFCIACLYSMGFIGNLVVPKAIDAVPELSLLPALAIDLGVLGLFAVQHSVMARKGFKQWWTQWVPTVVERSTYVLFSSVALIVLFWLWQPLGGMIWTVENPVGKTALYGMYGLGWVIVAISTFLIDHFDLFGLRQVYLFLKGKPYADLPFITPGFYRYVRHPLYVGWLIIFWATPTMTLTHLLFAVITSLYILVAVQFEERDLVQVYGESYARYQKQVPMLIPFSKLIPFLKYR